MLVATLMTVAPTQPSDGATAMHVVHWSPVVVVRTIGAMRETSSTVVRMMPPESCMQNVILKLPPLEPE